MGHAWILSSFFQSEGGLPQPCTTDKSYKKSDQFLTKGLPSSAACLLQGPMMVAWRKVQETGQIPTNDYFYIASQRLSVRGLRYLLDKSWFIQLGAPVEEPGLCGLHHRLPKNLLLCFTWNSSVKRMWLGFREAGGDSSVCTQFGNDVNWKCVKL